MCITDIRNAMYLLFDIVTNISRIIQIAFRHQIVLSGKRKNLRHAIALSQLSRDLVGLAKFAFQLYEYGLHALILLIVVISEAV